MSSSKSGNQRSSVDTAVSPLSEAPKISRAVAIARGTADPGALAGDDRRTGR
jgi:hypothetical protein